MKTIGILGGLGPKATADLYLDIVEDKELKDYPNILISNVSFPKGVDEDIIRNKKDTKLMLNPLLKSISQLNKAGAEVIILPCNTLEDLCSQLTKNKKITLITPLTETANVVEYLGIKKIGVIATSKTNGLKLYNRRLQRVEIIYPSDESQKEISLMINRAISRKSKQEDKEFINNLIKNLKSEGCEKIILGCTDLSPLVEDNDYVLDSFKILEKKILSILRQG
jgi:aspartate racemase